MIYLILIRRFAYNRLHYDQYFQTAPKLNPLISMKKCVQGKEGVSKDKTKYFTTTLQSGSKIKYHQNTIFFCSYKFSYT
jgi:hypothetical protein